MKLKHTKLQIVLEILSALVMVGMYVFLIINWADIPDQIPGHYDATGTINRWGNKSELFLLPVMGTVLYFLLTAIQFFPSVWNMPVSVTEDNKVRLYKIVKYLLLFMKLEIMLIYFYINYNSIEARPLPAVFLPITLITVFGTILFFIVKLVRASHH